MCLRHLRLWISKRNVQHYFVRANNIIDYKVTLDNQQTVESVIDGILKDGIWNSLQCCEVVANGYCKISSPLQRILCTPRKGHAPFVVANCALPHSLVILQCVQFPLCRVNSLEQSLKTQRSLLEVFESLWPRVLSKYWLPLIESNIGSLYHALYHKSVTRGQPDTNLAERAEEFLKRGADSLPPYGILRLANLYYSKQGYGDVHQLLSIVEKWPSDTQDEHALGEWYSSYHDVSTAEVVSDLLECYDNVDTPRLRGWSRIIDEAYKRKWIPVVFTLSEIPCVDKYIVYEIVAGLFDDIYPCAIMHPGTFECYLKFACIYRSGESLDIIMRIANSMWMYMGDNKECITPSIHSVFKMVALNTMAYCLVIQGEYKEAARHVVGSLRFRMDFTNAALHFLLAAYEFCQPNGTAGARDSQISTGGSRYLVLEGMVRRLRDKGRDDMADVIQGHVDDGSIIGLYSILQASQPKFDAVGTTLTIAITLMVLAVFCLALWFLFDECALYMRW
jgi:hypothetical protein